ncbi:MAG: cysteine--tRNA ligase [Candidatus Lokiarchaeota archaeon]|nr:cysteine--tRNA ligase [Candidatus Lokiarchaeota archaeon]
MTLRIYNTLTKDIEEFKPRNPPRVTMYACGPTVYDSPHVGHARSAVAFDVIRRYLEYKGYDVVFARNYTDIDDKMIDRASKRGITVLELAKQYIAEYEAAMDALNVKPPVYAPRATHNIPDMISFIQDLVVKGFAYAKNGSVYFSVPAFEPYGRLSRKPQKEIADIGRRDSEEFGDDKGDPRDFALWKAQKPGEPAWDSPWGKGRPGWHIECSVMSTKLLGETIDIHGGGHDLIFPHHENEIAQSEAHSGKAPFCRFWIHNGFVTVDKAKMSKSLNNFFTIEQVLEQYEAPAIRMFLLSAQYRNPIDYSKDLLDQATKNWQKIRDAWAASRAVLGAGVKGAIVEPVSKAVLPPDLAKILEEFEAAMDDDFNTPRALAALFSAIKAINENMAKGKDASVMKSGFHVLRAILGALGFDDAYMARFAKASAQTGKQLDSLIQYFISQRDAERKARNFKKADEIRDTLKAMGIELMDSKDGTAWKLVA